MGESKGYIQIHISGKEGIHELTPANYDIRQLREMLENVEDLLSLDGKISNALLFPMKFLKVRLFIVSSQHYKW